MNLKPNVKFKVFRSSVTETAKPFTTEKKNPPPRPPPPSLMEACPQVQIPPILENFMASHLDEINLKVEIEPSPPASPPGVPRPPPPPIPTLLSPSLIPSVHPASHSIPSAVAVPSSTDAPGPISALVISRALQGLKPVKDDKNDFKIRTGKSRTEEHPYKKTIKPESSTEEEVVEIGWCRENTSDSRQIAQKNCIFVANPNFVNLLTSAPNGQYLTCTII